MEAKRDSASDAILGAFLHNITGTDTVGTDESDANQSATNARKRVALYCDESSDDTHKWVDEHNASTQSDETHKWADERERCQREMQTITITTIDDDPSHIADKRAEESSNEFVTESMFSKFMKQQNAAMAQLKKSLDSMNDMMYIDPGSDYNGDLGSEECLPRTPLGKRSLIDNDATIPAKKSKTAAETITSGAELIDAHDKQKGAEPQIRQVGGCDVTGNTPKNVNKEVSDVNNENIFDVSNYIVEEKTSGPVKQQLADLTDKLLVNKLDDSKRNDLFDKHLRPENCKLLEFPRVNDFVWNYCMNENTRSSDVKMHKIQKTMLKGLGPVVKTVDKLLKPNSDVDTKEIAKELLDAIAMLASANAELSLHRKACIKNNMKPEYKKLCTSQTDITSFLFGDDVVEKMKNIGDHNKMAHKVAYEDVKSPYRGRGQRFNPRLRFRGRGRQNFLGRGAQRQQLGYQNYESRRGRR